MVGRRAEPGRRTLATESDSGHARSCGPGRITFVHPHAIARQQIGGRRHDRRRTAVVHLSA